MSAFEGEPSNLIGRSIKLLLRDRLAAVLRLAGMQIGLEAIRVEDPNLNLPELRADHVFIVDRVAPRRTYAVYLEYQLKPDPALLPVWCTKWGGLNKQLGMPGSRVDTQLRVAAPGAGGTARNCVPDERIVTGSYDKTARVWDARTGRPLLTLTGHTDSLDGVAFSHDGSRIATGSYDNTVKVWDARTGHELFTLNAGEPSYVGFSADGKRIVTGSRHGTAKVWDVQPPPDPFAPTTGLASRGCGTPTRAANS